MDAKMSDGKVAIISGASYGMGQTMAELFAEEGAKVVMTARRKEKLDAAVKAITEKGYGAGKGTQFAPKFADIMLEMIDEDTGYEMKGENQK